MSRLSLDKWEDDFIEICLELLEEEPLYPYEHLWKEGLSPKAAFHKYVEENPDYAEKLEEISSVPSVSQKESEDFLAMAKKLEAQKLKKEAEERLSRFCPECAREIGDKDRCKCGFRRKGKSSDSESDWLAEHGFDDLDEFNDDYDDYDDY